MPTHGRASIMGPPPPLPSPKLIFTVKEPQQQGKTALVSYVKLEHSPRTPGSFRVVEVAGLLKAIPEINVYEYPTINFHTKGYEKLLRSLGKQNKYIAISHVWSRGDEVDDELRKMSMTEKLDIKTDAAEPETISWHGLKQAAHAARQLPGAPRSGVPRSGVPYFWLDFLCLDQVSCGDMEKALQICIIGDVYRYATAVVVMIGGVAAAQSASSPTAWCDRAWTLQEAILNSNTWVMVLWPANCLRVRSWRFYAITGPGTSNSLKLCLVRLLELLDLADSQPPVQRGIPAVNVFDGKTPGAGDTPRRALRACLHPIPTVKYTGVWRSMFMRTSSLPVDVVYSIMTIFGVRIDPYRNARDPDFVFADLARKTAAKQKIGPVWLTIGGITGCAFGRNAESLVIPDFPHTSKAGKKSKNVPPQIKVGGKMAWVGHHVDDSPWYVKKYDMHFVSHSHPHIINALMFKVTVTRNMQPQTLKRVDLRSEVHRNRAKIKLGSMSGTCTYCGNLTQSAGVDIFAIYAGDIGDMSKTKFPIEFPANYLKRKPRFDGQKYILFMQYDRKTKLWGVAGDGAFRLRPGQKWSKSTRRQMIVLGKNSQNRIGRWQVQKKVTTPSDMDHRNRYFHNNYGVAKLPELGGTDYDNMHIDWIAIKHQTPPKSKHSPWIKQSVTYDLGHTSQGALARTWAKTLLLRVHSYPYTGPPTMVNKASGGHLTRDGHGVVSISYDGWSRSACSQLSLDGMAALMVPNLNKTGTVGTVNYETRIWFGNWVMYVQIRYHPQAPPEFWQLVVVPYRQGTKGGIVVG